jgi:hypothetical protein
MNATAQDDVVSILGQVGRQFREQIVCILGPGVIGDIQQPAQRKGRGIGDQVDTTCNLA